MMFYVINSLSYLSYQSTFYCNTDMFRFSETIETNHGMVAFQPLEMICLSLTMFLAEHFINSTYSEITISDFASDDRILIFRVSSVNFDILDIRRLIYFSLQK